MIVALRGGGEYQPGSSSAGSSWLFNPAVEPITVVSGIGDESPRAVGLDAVAAAVRLISETIGSFVMRVYEGSALSRRPVMDAPQARLLQAGASDGYTSFDLWSDVATSIELFGNAFIWKQRDRGGKTIGLWAYPAQRCQVVTRVDDGAKRILATVGGERRDITDDVIHVRGWSPIQALSGAGTLDLHRGMLDGASSLEQFRGRYFDSDATPSLVLTHPDILTPDQRKELRESWNARHRGPSGEKTGVLWGGMTVQQLSSTLGDAQVAELAASDVMKVARAFRIYPPGLLSASPDAVLPEAEVVSDLFMRFSLLHRVRRIERAISSDRDVFPNGNADRYARMDVSELLRGDIATMTDKVHKLKQVGMMTANEGRAEIGMEPSDDPSADKLLETPVGGAPNGGG